MRRPWLVIVAVVLEGVLGLILFATAVFMVVAARLAGNLDAAEITAASILCLIGLVVLTSCFGLLKSRSWGWWLAETANLVGLVAFLWDPVTRRVRPDPDETAFIVLFGVLLLLFLLAPVRGFFLRKKENMAERNVES